MIEHSKRLLLIVGAGASAEVNMPTGNELKNIIAGYLNYKGSRGESGGDNLIYEILAKESNKTKNPSKSLENYISAAHKIRDAMPQAPSIDNFIDAHRGNKEIEFCGKLAIARSILKEERKSSLYFEKKRIDSQINFKGIEGTWFNSFMQILTENCTIDDIPVRLSDLAMIIFNYDRCIEHYLFNSFQNYYNITELHAAELVDRIEIYHPYGKVGHLPWQQKEDSMAFGAEPKPNDLLNISSQIRTFTEGTDPKSSEITSIQNLARNSTIILFLGFAFHKLNLQILKPDNGPLLKDIMNQGGSQLCFATAHGISDHDCGLIKNEILMDGFSGGNIHINNEQKCNGLFDEYRRGISFA